MGLLEVGKDMLLNPATRDDDEEEEDEDEQ